MLKDSYDDVAFFKDDIISLRQSHDSGNYFKVIIAAPQLIDRILEKISEAGDEYIERKMGEVDEDDLEVYQMHSRLLQDETIKARIAGCLVNYYENNYWESNDPLKKFKKYFTKIENLIACRNIIAHELYINPVTEARLKRTSFEAIELIELFAYHETLYW